MHIPRGYYVRWKAIDHCVRRFLQATVGYPKRQILSLGSGFDSLYFRFNAEAALVRTVVFEVDFPDVASRKASLISGNIALRETLDFHSLSSTGPAYVSSDQYHLLGLDVREESQVEEALSEAGLDWEAPTLLLSEVVLTYMESKWSDSIIGWAAKLLPQALFIMYEQIRPNDPFGRIMQDHFLKLNSTLHALQQYPDIATQRQRFLDKGWEKCVCLDMNDFYLGLVHQEERRRVENLEPFDEYEEWHQKCSHYFILTASRGSLTMQALLALPPVSPAPSISPTLGPIALSVRTMPEEVCVEGLGMASTCLGPGQILLTGGSNRGGRGLVPRLLLRSRTNWRCVSMEPSTDLGVRLYHTLTPLPGGGAVLYGGRSSPLNPTGSLFKVTLDLDPCGCQGSLREDQDTLKLCAKVIACTGDLPQPRWRHTATVISHGDKDFLFVFGGRNVKAAVLGDYHFLSLKDWTWTEILVEGTPPAARFSHSACPYSGGLVMFGGLGTDVPLGDTVLLRSTDRGFHWDRLQVDPPPIPRYSHSAHVIGDQLVLVGGVWLHSEGIPGIALIDLITGSSMEFTLDTAPVPWPLMLHSFCSELTDSEESAVLLIGGGGNCFSFGTHLNPQPVTVNLSTVLK